MEEVLQIQIIQSWPMSKDRKSQAVKTKAAFYFANLAELHISRNKMCLLQYLRNHLFLVFIIVNLQYIYCNCNFDFNLLTNRNRVAHKNLARNASNPTIHF